MREQPTMSSEKAESGHGGAAYLPLPQIQPLLEEGHINRVIGTPSIDLIAYDAYRLWTAKSRQACAKKRPSTYMMRPGELAGGGRFHYVKTDQRQYERAHDCLCPKGR